MISIATSISNIAACAAPTAPAVQVAQGQTADAGATFSATFAQMVARLGFSSAPMQLLGAFPLDGTASPADGNLGEMAGAEAGDASAPDRLTMELLTMLAQDPTLAQRLLTQQSPVTQTGSQPSLTVTAVGGEAAAQLVQVSGQGQQTGRQMASVVGQGVAATVAAGTGASRLNVPAVTGTPAADASQATQVTKPNDLGGAIANATDASDVSDASVRQGNGRGTVPAASYLAAASRVARDDAETSTASTLVTPRVELPKTPAGKEAGGGEVLLPLGVASGTVAARQMTAQAVSEPVVLSPLETKGWQEIANRIHMTFVDGRTEARIHLWPPELGRIEVRLVVDGQQVGVQLGANSAKAQDLIQANMPLLRTALTEHGLKVGDLTVVLDQFGLANQSMGQHGQAGAWMAGQAMPTPWFDEEPDQRSNGEPAELGDVDLVGRRANSLVDCQA